jgi:Rieske Fe-S protein
MDDRRQFFSKILGGIVAAVAVLKSGVASARKLGVSLKKVPSLAEIGGSATVKIEGKELLLVRDAKSSVRALSAKCTHRNCNVTYNAKSKKIECKCHGSYFDLTGKVLAGPAPAALKCYGASLSDDKIVLTVD